jgi:hypothetical protein
VLALANLATVLRSGLRNPRWSYLPIDPDNAAAVEFANRAKAQHVPEIDLVAEHGTFECWVLDHGPGGMIGGIVRSVYAELGLPPPEPPEVSSGATADDVRAALRVLDKPTELAASPLARGETPEERAGSVRATINEAIAAAFGDGAEEQLLVDVLRRGYLEPAAGSHESAAHDLHLSRATYFRKLKTASDRVAEWVVTRGEAASRQPPE